MPKQIEETKRRLLDEKVLVLRHVSHKEIVKHKPTPHQRRVYALTQLIPAGAPPLSLPRSSAWPWPSPPLPKAQPGPFFPTFSGKVTTYAAIAAVLASAPRAVGQALRNNPFAPIVPCHRIISSQRTTGGFSGEAEERQGEQVQRKIELLRKEGVDFPQTIVGKVPPLPTDSVHPQPRQRKLDQKYVLGAEELVELVRQQEATNSGHS